MSEEFEESDYQVTRRTMNELHSDNLAEATRKGLYLKTVQGQVDFEIGNYRVWLGQMNYPESEAVKHFGEYLNEDWNFTENARKMFRKSDGCDEKTAKAVAEARKSLAEKLKELEAKYERTVRAESCVE